LKRIAPLILILLFPLASARPTTADPQEPQLQISLPIRVWAWDDYQFAQYLYCGHSNEPSSFERDPYAIEIAEQDYENLHSLLFKWGGEHGGGQGGRGEGGK